MINQDMEKINVVMEGKLSIRLGRTLEEVREHLLQFEGRRKDASLWSTWDDVDARLHQKHPWLK